MRVGGKLGGGSQLLAGQTLLLGVALCQPHPLAAWLPWREGTTPTLLTFLWTLSWCPEARRAIARPVQAEPYPSEASVPLRGNSGYNCHSPGSTLLLAGTATKVFS